MRLKGHLVQVLLASRRAGHALNLVGALPAKLSRLKCTRVIYGVREREVTLVHRLGLFA